MAGEHSRANGRKGGRPPHVPTPALREKVRNLAIANTNQERIAAAIGLKIDALAKYYREELDSGLTDQIDEAVGILGKCMRSPDLKIALTAVIFFLKTRARFRETDEKDLNDMKINIAEIAEKLEKIRPDYVREY